MKKQFLSILAILLFISCTNPNNPDNENKQIIMDTTNWKEKANYKLLQQVWKTEAAATMSKVFKYADANNTAALNSYNTYPNVNGMNYNMVIEAIGWISDTEGIMYGKYKYISDYTLLNKYYAIAFKNLTESSVDFSEASLADKKYTETLEEATNTFRIESNAFKTYNSYTVYIQ
ncbi:hypothetical protein R4I97_11770 [Brachyspira pilosicoli]|uniref:hypothetical protein n=1 Tax=Brachyspira pilosicoli TaxID=52584 RepID=UPI0030079DB3